MTSDKRELILRVKAEDQASKPLKNIGDAADDTKGDLSDLNVGLKKLDDAMAEASSSATKLRTEIAKTGDLDLVKDLAKQEQRLKAFARQRKLLLGEDDRIKVGTARKLDLPDIDVTRAGIGIAAKLGPVIVGNLPKALGAGSGVGAAVGAPIVAGVAAWLATAANGAILGAAAAGVVAGGIKIAARDPAVQAAGSELSAAIGRQLEDSAAPFVPATLKAIGTVRSGFRDLDEDLDDIFGRGAGYVQPLTDGVIGLVREAVPGFRAIVRAAGPVVDMLGGELPELGRDIEQTLSGLAEHGPAAAKALGTVLDVAGEGIKAAGQALQVASIGFKYADIIGGALTGGVAGAAKVAGEYVHAAEQADGETRNWADGLANLGSKASAAAADVESLYEANQRIVAGNLSLAESNLRAAEAFDTAKEAVDGKKRITRGEESALYDLANALNDTTTALDGQGVSALEATEHNESARAKFVAAATAAGHTRKRAEELATAYLKLPRGVSTTITAKDHASRPISTIRKALDGLKSKTVNIYTVAYHKNASGTSVGKSMGGRIDGPGPKGVDSLPHLLAPGEYVLSAKDVDRLGGFSAIDDWRKGLHDAARPAAVAASGGAGGRVAVDVRLSASGGTGPLQDLVRAILPLMRVEVINGYGGSAQRAIGAN